MSWVASVDRPPGRSTLLDYSYRHDFATFDWRGPVGKPFCHLGDTDGTDPPGSGHLAIGKSPLLANGLVRSVHGPHRGFESLMAGSVIDPDSPYLGPPGLGPGRTVRASTGYAVAGRTRETNFNRQGISTSLEGSSASSP